MTTIIHINRKLVEKGENRPIKIMRGKTTIYANEIRIKGESKIVYSPNKALRDGAKLWIETEAELGIIN